MGERYKFVIGMAKDIQLVNRYFHPVMAGIETGMAETFSRLAARGWHVLVHTSCNSLEHSNALPAEAGEFRGIAFRRYPFVAGGFFPHIDWDSRGVITLKNFDVVPQGWFLAYAWVLKVFGRKRFVLTVDPHGGFTPAWAAFPPHIRFVKQLYHRTLGQWLVNGAADGVHALSELERRALIAAGIRAELITIIPNGVPDDAFADLEELASPDAKELVRRAGRYFVQLGRIHPVKNYETAIRTLAKLPNDVSFLIVGPAMDPVYRAWLGALIAELGLVARVTFTGELRGADKYYVLRHAAAMVHLSRFEAYPNAVLDGMSQGLPLVVSDHPSLTQLVRDEEGGYVVGVEDDKAAAERIARILAPGNAVSLRAMGERNIAFCRAQTWEAISRRVEIWYENLVTGSRSF